MGPDGSFMLRSSVAAASLLASAALVTMPTAGCGHCVEVNTQCAPLYEPTFDNVYEVISTNIPTEIKQEIEEIAAGVGEWEARVAKALVLLEFAGRAYTTEENLAAVLHPHGADS